jgi:hypothetical protein
VIRNLTFSDSGQVLAQIVKPQLRHEVVTMKPIAHIRCGGK